MITEKTFNRDINGKDDDVISLREVFEKYFYYWKWYVLSLLLAITLALYYLKSTNKQYEVSTTIFIDDKESGGLASELSAMEDLGVLSSGANKTVVNETGVLKSRSLMRQVVKTLNLNITLLSSQKFQDIDLYNNSPLEVNFHMNDNDLSKMDTIFSIIPKSETLFLLKDIDGNLIKEGSFGEKITMGFGDISVTTLVGKKIIYNDEIIVKVQPLKKVVDKYLRSLMIALESKKSSLLILTLRDNVKQRAKDILNNLVNTYNIDAIDYKTVITKNTDKFINDRIIEISVDLSSIDMGVENFKTENKLTDIDLEANMALTTNSQIQQTIVDLNSQIQIIDFVSNHLTNNKDALIPANLGLKDAATNSNTDIYNRLLLERQRIIKGSSSLNPTVINLDSQLATLKQSIEQSLINLRSSLDFSLKEAKKQEYILNQKRGKAPKQEREFQDIKRKQLIIETLYLYLLQKREENAISLGIPVPNAKVIDEANGSDLPVSPSSKLIYLVSFFMGVLIPSFFIFIMSFLNNKIQTVEDIEKIYKIPILGDIPKGNSKDFYLIKENDRSSIAEAFRILRANITYMLFESKFNSNTIFITSTIGGEGKTYISINLASVLTSLNKKVLVIGADMRKPKIDQYMKTQYDQGLSNFLSDPDVGISDIIDTDKTTNFDVILSGDPPPNPNSLLLNNNRFGDLIAYARQKYDYVIVDTPPLSLVADTLLLVPYADLFIYVIRANYVDKRLIENANMFSKIKRLKNIAFLLNQSDYKKKGYGYGYGYGDES